MSKKPIDVFKEIMYNQRIVNKMDQVNTTELTCLFNLRCKQVNSHNLWQKTLLKNSDFLRIRK